MTKSKQTILDRVNRDFGFRPCPIGADSIRHYNREQARSILGSAALDLVRICPQSRELNTALNKIDEAVMWAHAAIDRQGISTPDSGA